MEELKKKTNIGYSILSILLTDIRSRTCSIDIKTGKFEIRDAELSQVQHRTAIFSVGIV